MEDGKDCVILLDNGSLRAAAAMQLRALASGLSEVLGLQVHPVSLLHSSKVDESELGGVAADTLMPFLRKKREMGVNRFRIVPLFFGPSEAITRYLPERVEALRIAGWVELEVVLAEPLAVDVAGVQVVAEILCELVGEVKAKRGWDEPRVVLVDHGTPVAEVNAVREQVAEALGGLLGSEVTGCAMERREGAEYDFNEPLLENLLGSAGCDGDVVVAMMFLSPGRHAGEGGDVWEICEQACLRCDGLRVAMSGLISDRPQTLLDLLAAKYWEKWGR